MTIDVRAADAILLSGDLTGKVGDNRLLVLVDEESWEIRSELWPIASDTSLEYDVVLSVRVFARSRLAETRRILLPHPGPLWRMVFL